MSKSNEIRNHNLLVLTLVWILYAINIILNLTSAGIPLSNGPVEFILLFSISFLAFNQKWAKYIMYIIVTFIFAYLFVLINTHTYLITYTFVWIVLIICSIYKNYKIILLGSFYSIIFTIYSFSKFRFRIFSYLPSVYVKYFIIYGIFITIFLLIYTRYTEILINRAESSSEKLKNILDSVDIFTWTWDKNSNSISFSNETEKNFNLSDKSSFLDIDIFQNSIYPEDIIITKDAVKSLKTGESKTVEYRVIDKKGQVRWIQNRIIPIKDENDDLIRVDGVVIDITDRKSAEEKINYLAYHDGLTGLPNRHLFNRHLSGAIFRSKIDNKNLAILFIDMDDFKKINDNYGHDVGDVVIRNFSRRLKEAVGEETMICRMGGDEFIVLLEDMPKEKVNLEIKNIKEALKNPIIINNNNIFINASIGISFFPDDGKTIKELIKAADNHMYFYKRQKPGNCDLINKVQ